MYTSCMSPCCPTHQLISGPEVVCAPGMASVGQRSASQSCAWAGSPWRRVACTPLQYTLYRIAQPYGHPCPEAAFINIKLPKTRERYEQICDQVLKEI